MLGPLPALFAKEEIARWKSELILRSPTFILDVITYGTKRYNAALGYTNNKYDRWYNTGRVLALTVMVLSLDINLWAVFRVDEFKDQMEAPSLL
ncbi:hypothetical protein PR003_g7924 [Phytophthora rubi]|nr:hypothetical protein PR002_g9579 [Phytophthora rubi]KAE9345490.1 hypothetical protein PR003_g7924 [Phytophthora rubi]